MKKKIYRSDLVEEILTGSISVRESYSSLDIDRVGLSWFKASSDDATAVIQDRIHMSTMCRT